MIMRISGFVDTNTLVNSAVKKTSLEESHQFNDMMPGGLRIMSHC